MAAMTQNQKKLLRDRSAAVMIGFLVTGFLLWIHRAYGESFNNLLTNFYVRCWNHVKSFPASISWIDFTGIGILIGVTLFLYSPARNFYFRQNSLTWTKLLCLTFSICFQILSLCFPSSPGLILIASGFVVASVAGCRWPDEIKKKEPPEDKLYRKFFSSRIAKHLESKDGFIRRIAVLGPWGSGKSYVLKFIQEDLENSTEQEFRVAWVNPWKASSREKAVEMLAEAIDQAVDPLSMTKWNWHQSKWLRVIASIFTEKKIGQQFLEAVTSHLPQTGDAYLCKVDNEVKKRGFKVVIFVDDMERAEPHIVRSILPVVDRLAELKNFYFIFAIDPLQLELSFGTRVSSTIELGKSTSSESSIESKMEFKHDSLIAKDLAQGFLDKVMDLQLVLPDPTIIEIHQWMQGKVDAISTKCPKLKSAFDRFSPDLLPTNPRICEKFLREAERIEVLFLEDYQLDEKNYYALFLVILADVQLPGFKKAVGRHFGKIAVEADMATSTQEIIESSTFSEIVKNVTSEIGVIQQESNAKYVRAKHFIIAMCDLVGINAIIFKPYELDLEWTCSGYLTRLYLPFSQMKSVASAWKKDTENRSLLEILKQAHEYKPSHEEATLFQILELQLSKIKKSIQNARKPSRPNDDINSDIDLAIRNLKPFSRHFHPSRGPLEPVEENLLTPQLVEGFMDLIRSAPIRDNESTEWLELREAIIDAFATVVSAVPWDRKRSISLDRRQLDSGFITDNEDKSAAQGMLSEVRNRANRSIVNQFIERMKSPAGIHPFWYDQFCPTPILEPGRWIPRSSAGFDLELITQMRELAKYSSVFLRNIRLIVKDVILEPFVDRFEGYSMSPEQLGRMLIDENPSFRNYLGLFWTTAVENLDDPETLDELLRIRKNILQSLEEDAAHHDGSNDAGVTFFSTEQTGSNEKSNRTMRSLTGEEFAAAFPLPIQPATTTTEPLTHLP